MYLATVTQPHTRSHVLTSLHPDSINNKINEKKKKSKSFDGEIAMARTCISYYAIYEDLRDAQ